MSQLLHVMDKDDPVVIDDYDAPLDNMTLYEGVVRGIKKDDPINKMHVVSICANGDVLLILAEREADNE